MVKKKYNNENKVIKHCNKGCCFSVSWNFEWIPQPEWDTLEKYKPVRTKKRRAGILIIDDSEIIPKIFLIQSCGNLWGPPKGGVYDNETIKQGALREFYEETGVKLNVNLEKCKSFKLNESIYFIIYLSKDKISKIKPIDDPLNDASGYTWIKIDCLYLLENKNFERGKKAITGHCKKLLKLLKFI
tara:strand:- start:76 stop:633 length:558 start_codon:yes stop_codon:yes gene_type:complete